MNGYQDVRTGMGGLQATVAVGLFLGLLLSMVML